MIRGSRLGDRLLIPILILGFGFATGLLGKIAARASPEDPDAAEVQALPVPHPRPDHIPDSEKQRKNPVPASAESIEWGRTLYSTQCLMCHGVRGDGKGDLALTLKLEIPDLTQAKSQDKKTDGEYFYIIQKGRADMPPETRLEERDIWGMINYVRTFPAKNKAKK